MEIVVRHRTGEFRIVRGGGNRPADALRFIGPSVARAFLESDPRALSTLQQGREGLGLSQSERLNTMANSLWRGDWHAVPARSSAGPAGSSSAGAKSGAALARTSQAIRGAKNGAVADPSPLRVYPREESIARPQPEPPRDYKIVVEVAGRGGHSPLSMDARPLDAPMMTKDVSRTDSGLDAPRRTQLAVSGLAPAPHRLRLLVPMQGSSPMVLSLGKPLDPVEKSAHKARWDTVLVPLLPLCHYGRPDPRERATRPARGWIYVYLKMAATRRFVELQFKFQCRNWHHWTRCDRIATGSAPARCAGSLARRSGPGGVPARSIAEANGDPGDLRAGNFWLTVAQFGG